MASTHTEKSKKAMKDLELKLTYQRDKDREPVRGIFRFHEVRGGRLEFVYRKYKQDEVERYDLVDGQTYTIPLGVAKHINKNMWYPIHSHALDEDGKSSVRIGEKVQRASFQSLEFVDLDDITPAAQQQIITVEKI